MLHVSTRGEAPALGFADALLAGLARDGGLYLPRELAGSVHRDDPGLFRQVLCGCGESGARRRSWTATFREADLNRMIDEAYAGFRHPATCPLVQLDDNLFVLELFHGPTLAFKDVAMQLLGRLMDHVLRARGNARHHRRRDLGRYRQRRGRSLHGASIRSISSSSIPHGRVSDVQRRQMTTVASPNVHALAIEGTFDDCQIDGEGHVQSRPLSRRAAACPASIPSTGRGSPRRSCITSPPPSLSARRTGASRSRSRRAISAISWRASSPSAWACRSSG